MPRAVAWIVVASTASWGCGPRKAGPHGELSAVAVTADGRVLVMRYE